MNPYDCAECHNEGYEHAATCTFHPVNLAIAAGEFSPVCPHCGMTTVFRPGSWVPGDPLRCVNPLCVTNHVSTDGAGGAGG